MVDMPPACGNGCFPKFTGSPPLPSLLLVLLPRLERFLALLAVPFGELLAAFAQLLVDSRRLLVSYARDLLMFPICSHKGACIDSAAKSSAA